MSKKKNTNNNTEEVKTIINNMNEQINEMKQKMNILIEKLAENGNEETNIITKKSAKNKVKRNKQKTETNVVADIPNQANSDNTDNSKVVKTRNKKKNNVAVIPNEPILENTNNNQVIKTRIRTPKADTNIVAVIPNQDNLDNTSNTKVVRTRNKKTKAQTFQNERTLFIDELEKKMGLTETNRGVLLYELENNEELKKYLRDKIPEIQKLYKCGCWNYFIKLNSNSKVSELGLLKSIFKNEKYNLLNKKTITEIDGNKKACSMLFFFKI